MFLDAILDSYLVQVVDIPTRGDNILDLILKRGCIGFKYYADAIHSGLTPAGVFFFGVHAWLVMTFNYLILWVRVKGQG